MRVGLGLRRAGVWFADLGLGRGDLPLGDLWLGLGDLWLTGLWIGGLGLRGPRLESVHVGLRRRHVLRWRRRLRDRVRSFPAAA